MTCARTVELARRLCEYAQVVNWDDIRYVLAVAKSGSLIGAARELRVNHTTVGRHIDAAEDRLGVRLFTRTPRGYVPTAEAERMLPSMVAAEDAMLAVERAARAQDQAVAGTVRVTSPETLGSYYLAGRLAAFGVDHPDLVIELLPAGDILDLARREAEVALRTFKTDVDGLVVRKVATMRYGMYASAEYLRRRPLEAPEQLVDHSVLNSTDYPGAVEPAWLRRLMPGATARFVSTLSSSLLAAAKASAGVAILPCYLAHGEPTLKRIPMPDPPSETLWLTVHRDLRETPRIRALLDFLVDRMREDAALFEGAP